MRLFAKIEWRPELHFVRHLESVRGGTSGGLAGTSSVLSGTSSEGLPNARKPPVGGFLIDQIPAASYSPTPSPRQYHRRWRA
jgi:hypothetical protein